MHSHDDTICSDHCPTGAGRLVGSGIRVGGYLAAVVVLWVLAAALPTWAKIAAALAVFTVPALILAREAAALTRPGWRPTLPRLTPPRRDRPVRPAPIPVRVHVVATPLEQHTPAAIPGVVVRELPAPPPAPRVSLLSLLIGERR